LIFGTINSATGRRETVPAKVKQYFIKLEKTFALKFQCLEQDVLYQLTFRLLGIKVSVLARTKERIRSELVLVVIFGVILIAGRQVRLLGFEFAPHIAALISGGYMVYLLYKYPTGEYLTMNKK
jgi:hypothetical protein